MLRLIRNIFALLLVILAVSAAYSQSADNKGTLYPRPDDDEKNDRPLSIQESLEKLRIEKEKKEFAQMLDRGEQVVKITSDLETAYEKNGKLTEKEMSKLANVEKLAKQIRSELGGDDDDTDAPAPPADGSALGDLIKTLKNSTSSLLDELKKTTRFSISAAAIQNSNAVLRLVRFLRFTR